VSCVFRRRNLLFVSSAVNKHCLLSSRITLPYTPCSSYEIFLFKKGSVLPELSLQQKKRPYMLPLLAHTYTQVHWLSQHPLVLADSTVRHIYLRVYDIRDNSFKSVPSPLSQCGILWFLVYLTRTRYTDTQRYQDIRLSCDT